MEIRKLHEDRLLEVRELEKKLHEVKKCILLLEGIITNHDEHIRSWLAEVPAEILDREEIRQNKVINWKKIVVQLIQEFDTPMTSEMLYNKLMIKYKDVPDNRVFVIRNISAALHYHYKENKLIRVKGEKGRGYVYGLMQFFGIDLRLKPHYKDKYLLESGLEM